MSDESPQQRALRKAGLVPMVWRPGRPMAVGPTWLLWPDGKATTDVVMFGHLGRGALKSGRALFDCTHHCPIPEPVMPEERRG